MRRAYAPHAIRPASRLRLAHTIFVQCEQQNWLASLLLLSLCINQNIFVTYCRSFIDQVRVCIIFGSFICVHTLHIAPVYQNQIFSINWMHKKNVTKRKKPHTIGCSVWEGKRERGKLIHFTQAFIPIWVCDSARRELKQTIKNDSVHTANGEKFIQSIQWKQWIVFTELHAHT